MPTGWLSIFILVLAVAGFVIARSRAVMAAGGNLRLLHSRPTYYGFNALVLTAVPAMILIALWSLLQQPVIDTRILSQIPSGIAGTSGERSLMMADIQRIANGVDAAVGRGDLSRSSASSLLSASGNVPERLKQIGVVAGADTRPEVFAAAESYRSMNGAASNALFVLALLMAVGGFGWSVAKSSPSYRARNSVERSTLVLLGAAASIAILTTVGIVLSMLFETISFFQQYEWQKFFFGLIWAPNFRGGSDLGLLPLLWGTLYISFVALLVAVPIGLMAAVYLAEYAGPRMRAVAKPLIEILAGIPTIVYGLFALIVVGPVLRDYFAQPLGLGNSSSSVMTAGLVMGIMLIPFVSSLSDDIITAVPQAMRDGSLGIGATRSETIRLVILPAALPGIVGAVLLATSRAIGETMIVVLGAGASAKLGLNPFEAMTTVTVKIVSQLTGDTDFASPETLVAFALGFTLFIITLGLNIFALYIVRRYREQYE